MARMGRALSHRFILYSDEAFTSASGLRYHHFYGGLLVAEPFLSYLESALKAALAPHRGEMKWQKVDRLHLPYYSTLMNTLFDELAKGYLKIRVMYLDKYFQPSSLSRAQRETTFQRLYYTFIAKGFGWRHADISGKEAVVLRLFMDQLPDKHEKNLEMKNFLRGIPRTRAMSWRRMIIPEDGVSEVDSRDHVVLQALDVLIGCLGFRLNRLHEVKDSAGRIGARTRAKFDLYKQVQKRLYAMGVKNIGITTGRRRGEASLWEDPIRLWRLQPKDAVIDQSWNKSKKK